MANIIREALDDLDAGLERVGGCSDGGCVVRRPVGMHTNGGCRCSEHGPTMRHLSREYRKFADAVRTIALAD